MVRYLDVIAAIHAQAPLPALTALRWKARVVLIFASPGRRRAAYAQARALGADADAVRDRDLRIVVVEDRTVDGLADAAADLRRRFGIGADAFAVLLVGKDGHVARRSATPVEAADLFAQIDAMPMARDERRRRGR